MSNNVALSCTSEPVASDCCIRLLLQTVISTLDVGKIVIIAAMVQLTWWLCPWGGALWLSPEPTYLPNRQNIYVIQTFSAVGGDLMSRLRQEEEKLLHKQVQNKNTFSSPEHPSHAVRSSVRQAVTVVVMWGVPDNGPGPRGRTSLRVWSSGSHYFPSCPKVFQVLFLWVLSLFFLPHKSVAWLMVVNNNV